MSTAHAMQTAALAYAEQGWKVFPALIIKSNGKWQKLGYLKGSDTNGQRWGATCDPDTIIAYWRKHPKARIGIPTGSANGFFVIDVDTPEGHDKDGFASLKKLETTYGPLPQTRMARSVTGSIHYYYKLPPGVIINSRSLELFPGIDIKGEGGMVIAPPSTHPRGGQYVWINDLPIADAPPWLIELTRKSNKVVRHKKMVSRRPKTVCFNDPVLDALMEQYTGAGISTDPDDNHDLELEMRVALSRIPADDYFVWLYVGAAIYDGLGEAGFPLFVEWSQRSAKYKDVARDACKWKWPECREMREITVATIFYHANQHDPGWREIYRRLSDEVAV
jgi:hypothetical protein